jgi:hypothetical protein
VEALLDVPGAEVVVDGHATALTSLAQLTPDAQRLNLPPHPERWLSAVQAEHKVTIYVRETQDGPFKIEQLWSFYLHQFGQLGIAGPHEGDWEMIQILSGIVGKPAIVALSEHAGGAFRFWPELGLRDASSNGPDLFVALGTQATYFDPVDLPWERADGKGMTLTPALVDYVPIPADAPWARWGGVWGNSKSSPVGPIRHEAWARPWHWTAQRCRHRPPG